MTEYRKKFVAIDLETTHLDQRQGKIMEVGACEFELYWNPSTSSGPHGRVEVAFGKTFSCLVNPEIEPSDTALAITGIKKEELIGAPKWPEVRAQLTEVIGQQTIVGHNIGFDMGYLGNQGLKITNPTLDTLELGRTLLPLLESHSLESLAEGFGVLEDTPHRALVDCQNTARVAAAILNEFLTYPKKLQQEVKDILGKSHVNIHSVLARLPEVQLAPRPSEPVLQAQIDTKAVEIGFVDKTVYCYPLSFNRTEMILANLAGGKESAVIGHANPALLGRFPRLASPQFALCEKRFQWLLSQDRLSESLARMAAKIKIYMTLERDLDLSRLKWSPDEAELLHVLRATPELCLAHGCGFAKSFAKKITAPIFASLETVFDLCLRWKPDFKKSSLLLFDVAAIEDRFTDSVIERWNLKKIRNLFAPLYEVAKGQASMILELPTETETILNEMDLFFGILHLIYLKRDGQYAENLIIDETERNEQRFAKLFHPAQKLKTKLENFSLYLFEQASLAEKDLQFEILALKIKIDAVGKFIETFFLAAREENILWLKFNPYWVDLNLQPRDMKQQWQMLSEKFSTVTIVDAMLPEASKAYYQNRLGLGGYNYKKCFATSEPQIPVKIFSQNISPQQQARFFFNLPGRSLLLVPNEGLLAEIYEMLSKHPDESVQVLAYKFSGSVAALKKKLKNFPGEKLLLVLSLNALVKHWKNLPPLDNLVIFRLPFEARGSKPTLLGLDGPSVFVEAILPRAIGQLHRVMSAFLSAPQREKPASSAGKEIFILDQRILTDYDQSFMKYFEEFPDFLISTVTVEQILQIYAETKH